MIDYYDAFDDFLGGSWTEYADRPKSKTRKTAKRTTQYVGPGHTRVRYKHRTLNIRFKETEQQFRAKQKARRRAGARKGAKNRTYSTPRRKDEYYVEMRNGEMIYVDSKGRDVTYKVRRLNDDADREIIKRDLRRDVYNIEEMRALLKDAHWEEVSGNKRWSYDSKATVKEFAKYKKYWK